MRLGRRFFFGDRFRVCDERVALEQIKVRNDLEFFREIYGVVAVGNILFLEKRFLPLLLSCAP